MRQPAYKVKYSVIKINTQILFLGYNNTFITTQIVKSLW